MALAVNELTGWPVIAMEDPSTGFVDHAGVVSPSGQFVDGRGAFGSVREAEAELGLRAVRVSASELAERTTTRHHDGEDRAAAALLLREGGWRQNPPGISEAAVRAARDHPGHRFWHITRKPKFKVDPSKGGYHAYGLGGQTTWLWVTGEDHLFMWSIHPYLRGRKLAVEIDPREAEYTCYTTQVGRVSIPGECIVKEPAGVRVVRVMPLEEALAEAEAHRKLTSAWLGRHQEAVKGPRGYYLAWKATGDPVTFEEREFIDRAAHGPGYKGLVR